MRFVANVFRFDDDTFSLGSVGYAFRSRVNALRDKKRQDAKGTSVDGYHAAHGRCHYTHRHDRCTDRTDLESMAP